MGDPDKKWRRKWSRHLDGMWKPVVRGALASVTLFGAVRVWSDKEVVVQYGDRPADIEARTGRSWQQLCKMNPLLDANGDGTVQVDELYPGLRIKYW